MRIPADDNDRAEIAMTPLIDMMFLLIIFFLVATAFKNPELDENVRLPESEGGSPTRQRSEDIIVNVRQGGVLVVSGRIVTIDDLGEKLKKAAEKDPQQVVRVRGDGLAYHKQIVSVLEACRKAKIVNVGISTRIKQ
jgi:biopolymer transport protein ExbD